MGLTDCCSKQKKSGLEKPRTITQDENPERGNWGGKIDALLSYIGFCVGLGNVWRFPYLCYRNGGGAFLIPYFLMLILAGLPLYFLELAMGQYPSLGPSTVWAISPLFKGVGYTAVMASALCCIYYIVIIAYIIFYLFASMTKELPWGTCNNDWNTPRCMVRMHSDTNQTNVILNSTATSSSYTVLPENATGVAANMSQLSPKSPAEEYFENYVLQMSGGIDDLGHISWQLALCLLAAWIITVLCLIKGIKSTGKVVYFTATFPYIVLTILLIRGVTLPGSMDGLRFYLIPDFEKLKNPRVWGDAASQIFYSLGPAWGILITYGSYNKFHSNCHRDSIISAMTCCCTSLFAGCVIFSVIGFMSHELQQPIKDVMSSGPGLVFVVYPEALTRMPCAPLWSVIFFCMLFTIALDSMFATYETAITALVDDFPSLFRKRRIHLTIAVAIAMFLMGLPQVTQGGIYILTLMDWYVGTFPPLFVALFEVLVISYVYGYDSWASDIQLMLGFRPHLYWRLTWLGAAPLAILFIIVFNAVIYTPVAYGSYVYPKWAEMLGWGCCMTSLICIPIGAIVTFQQRVGFGKLLTVARCPWTGKTWTALAGPTEDWCPASERRERKKKDLGLNDRGLNGDSIHSPIYKGLLKTENGLTSLNGTAAEPLTLSNV